MRKALIKKDQTTKPTDDQLKLLTNMSRPFLTIGLKPIREATLPQFLQHKLQILCLMWVQCNET